MKNLMNVLVNLNKVDCVNVMKTSIDRHILKFFSILYCITSKSKVRKLKVRGQSQRGYSKVYGDIML